MNHDMSSTPIENSFEFQRSCKKKRKEEKNEKSLVLWFGLMRDDDNKTHLSYANFTYSSYKCTIYVLVYYYTCKTSDCKTIYIIRKSHHLKVENYIRILFMYVCILLMFMKYCHFPKCPFSKLSFDLTAVFLHKNF